MGDGQAASGSLSGVPKSSTSIPNGPKATAIIVSISSTATGATVSSNINKEQIKSNVGKGYVDFTGIKTSSGNQTANLKSLEDYSVLIAD